MGLFDLFKKPKAEPRTVTKRNSARTTAKPKKLPTELDVAGESQTNDDGTDRQRVIARCKEGDSVRLVREPRNAYDKNAVAVVTSKGQIGYLSREDAAAVAPALDRGAKAQAHIRHIGGGTKDKPTRGVWLRIDWGE